MIDRVLWKHQWVVRFTILSNSSVGYSIANNRWVHTGLVKCTWSTSTLFWSALDTNLCVNGSCFTWLVVLSCHRNLKVSKCWSAISRKVKTFLETALIQSKRRNLMIKVSIISSHNLTLSHGQARNDEWEYSAISTKYW